jgi:cell division septation protein DedD
MKEKGNESSSSSLVIVSRRMLIAGIAGAALFSFGLGYFFGYGGATPNRIVKQVETDHKIIPSDERTVLDSYGKPTIVPPPATPGIIPKDATIIPERNKETASAPKTHEGKQHDTDASDSKSKDIGSGKGGEKDKVVKENEKQSAPVSKNSVHKHVSSKNEHVYAVQIGAFSELSKARRLKDQLSEKGYKAFITALTQESGKTLSSVRIGHYTTKKEAEELLSGLKSRGIEGIVVYGSR